MIAADTKVIIDDNALFRQAELQAEEDFTQINIKERMAHNADLQYVHIGGNIGIVANGAGLAMATMDAVNIYGGYPANFLDLGGGASHEQIMESIKLLENDKDVQCILINIFGGILNCDKLALSVITASQEIQKTKPIVLRLKGTNSEEAKQIILKDNSLGLVFEDEIDQAAQLP